MRTDLDGEQESRHVSILRIDTEGTHEQTDRVAVEEPLEIGLGFGPPGRREHAVLSVTMRTPGDDLDLAAGFLLTEGIIRGFADLQQLHMCGPVMEPGGHQNSVRAELAGELAIDPMRLRRHFYTSSSCGVCGKTSLEAVQVSAGLSSIASGIRVPASIVCELPETLRSSQEIFGLTGGLHAAALFTLEGRLTCVREDVGRHNALDKLVGHHVRHDALPLHDSLLLLSGRASFELLQKSFLAGIPVVASVGAPSSLAIAAADEFGITLVGWVRGDRCSVYTHRERVAGDPSH